MRMLRWICEHTRRDKIRNEDIQDSVWMFYVVDKLGEVRLRWLGHMRRDGQYPNVEMWEVGYNG